MRKEIGSAPFTAMEFLMISQIFESVCSQPWIIAVGTIAFFTVKGLAWLVVPAMMIRWRNRRLKKSRRQAA